MIPEHIKSVIELRLNDEIISSKIQSGGDINNASIIKLTGGESFFLKWNSSAPDHMFEAESKGLRLLADAKTNLIIPDVILTGKNFLLLSLLVPGSGNSDSAYNFGTELAKLHQHSADAFGLDHDNFIGKLAQSNNPQQNWADFFVSERIEPQIKLGIQSGEFESNLIPIVDTFHKTVQNLFPNEQPALLHGDLWSGNYMFTKSRVASIYDPAVYYGHREMDIAMTRLFGGFSSDFYDGYKSEYPLADGFEDRIELCNLYPILVHANLFGGGYIHRAKEILRQYS
ncbi:MAG: fructosamine kinase family protein [Balneola sp.]|nr:fructosamine kinase family protein [Balneola sp.]MBO6650308.1 fructosamine kinase family protein [Balneola sp.]MBO6712106.1 fructosamine kinase family protein [Balneola sp.]MBO6800300.1 fructosamine kinase family protein [Balneola sp.]MBO6869686.1 fructosamine kinase family protein [Balneola sp.]